jgi:hypothetical protein
MGDTAGQDAEGFKLLAPEEFGLYHPLFRNVASDADNAGDLP